jgi:Asp-tRNA(Asn)/Glu-tRNA(Gln) amidotransferase A subunit family amidase
MTHERPATAAVERSLRIITAREKVVKAWAKWDAGQSRRAAERVDDEVVGPMRGMTVGVKDIFATADYPTEYGSPLYRDHRESADAPSVSALRQAGGVVLGKTVTSEFACMYPGPTTNPHRPTHTPGGSSMGSAAAVATGMADVALGTQTAASIIRPAAYCGIYGFKPSKGVVSLAGIRLVAPSLDTVGWFARSPREIRVVFDVLAGHAQPATNRSPRIAACPTPQWGLAAPAAQLPVRQFLDHARERGFSIGPDVSADSWVGLAEAQQTVMGFEAATSFGVEHHDRSLSAELLSYLDTSAAITASAYDAALGLRDRVLDEIVLAFEGNDLLVTPAATGEAPLLGVGTGDPIFGRIWSLLGLPAISVPWGLGPTGLPCGVQIVGRPGADLTVLEAVVDLMASGDGA